MLPQTLRSFFSRGGLQLPLTAGWMLNEFEMLNGIQRSAGTEQRGGGFLISHF